MKIVEFEGCNATYAENQPEYLPLKCHKAQDGRVTTCWGLSFIERVRVALSGKIYLQVLTFNQPLQPLKMITIQPVQLDGPKQVPPGPPEPPRPANYHPVG